MVVVFHLFRLAVSRFSRSSFACASHSARLCARSGGHESHVGDRHRHFVADLLLSSSVIVSYSFPLGTLPPLLHSVPAHTGPLREAPRALIRPTWPPPPF